MPDLPQVLDDLNGPWNNNYRGAHPVTYQDKQIQCVECGNSFTFTAREQEFFASKGYANEPKRCLNCRQKRRTSGGAEGATGNASPRQMYPAVCAQCGKECQVPFQPRQGKPVYCSECYSANKVSR